MNTLKMLKPDFLDMYLSLFTACQVCKDTAK